MLNYRLPQILDREISDFEKLIDRYLQGDITFNELKAHRVPFGVYEQRKENTYMVRIRCAAGIITPLQLKKVAELSAKYGKDEIHLTTRQEIQIHDVDLIHLCKIIKELKTIGLSSRGGGGNTVRNIMADVFSGIHPDEVFDVTPFAVDLTSRMLEESDSWTLPRKFKISFSASPEDRGFSVVNDLGFVATCKEGQPGFKVTVAGGMGGKSSMGHLLFEFLPPQEVYPITKALKNLFNKYGNRRNKHEARIRFLWEQLGEEKFKTLLLEEFEKAKSVEAPLSWNNLQDNFQLKTQSFDVTPVASHDVEFIKWQQRYCQPQKQPGFYSVLIPVFLGNLENQIVAKLADFLLPLGEDVLRLSQQQNLLARNIPGSKLQELYEFLTNNFSLCLKPQALGALQACAGASTCKLGIGLSRGLAAAINRELSDSGLDLDGLQGIRVNISGCPNSCGQHLLADLGYFGKAIRQEGRLYPAYSVVAGARLGIDKPQFARVLGTLAARDVPAFHRKVMDEYLKNRNGYTGFSDYLALTGETFIIQLIKEYSKVPGFDTDKNYYFDWGAEELFSLAGRGVGECSSGIFDLIDLDKEKIKSNQKILENSQSSDAGSVLLYEILVASARMLLVTKGVEARNEEQVFLSFQEQFLDQGLVDQKYAVLLNTEKNNDSLFLSAHSDLILELAGTMIDLYDNMDDTLNFPTIKKKSDTDEVKPVGSPGIRVKDLRGIACPMNFVRVKLELAGMASGDCLEVWLDDGQPIQNVPGSVRSEGHKILDQKRKDEAWSLLIQKN